MDRLVGWITSPSALHRPHVTPTEHCHPSSPPSPALPCHASLNRKFTCALALSLTHSFEFENADHFVHNFALEYFFVLRCILFFL